MQLERELLEVRPAVRNMRPSGYHIQTDGSATRKVVENTGTAERPYFQCTGVPRHTHNSSAIMQITVKYSSTRSSTCSSNF